MIDERNQEDTKQKREQDREEACLWGRSEHCFYGTNCLAEQKKCVGYLSGFGSNGACHQSDTAFFRTCDISKSGAKDFFGGVDEEYSFVYGGFICALWRKGISGKQYNVWTGKGAPGIAKRDKS